MGNCFGDSNNVVSTERERFHRSIVELREEVAQQSKNITLLRCQACFYIQLTQWCLEYKQLQEQQFSAFLKKLDDLIRLNSFLLTGLNVYETVALIPESTISELKNQFCLDQGCDPLMCMASGVRGNTTLAHILPLSAKQPSDALNMLQLSRNELNSSKNALILSDNIKHYFDTLQLSFVPEIRVGLCQGYVMRIWTEEAKNAPLFDNSSRLIGEFEGHELAAPHTLFKRCLAYQAFWACGKYGNGVIVPTNAFDFNSLNEQDELVYFDLLKMKVRDMQIITLQEAAEQERVIVVEEEEEEVVWEENSSEQLY